MNHGQHLTYVAEIVHILLMFMHHRRWHIGRCSTNWFIAFDRLIVTPLQHSVLACLTAAEFSARTTYFNPIHLPGHLNCSRRELTGYGIALRRPIQSDWKNVYLSFSFHSTFKCFLKVVKGTSCQWGRECTMHDRCPCAAEMKRVHF